MRRVIAIAVIAAPLLAIGCFFPMGPVGVFTPGVGVGTPAPAMLPGPGIGGDRRRDAGVPPDATVQPLPQQLPAVPEPPPAYLLPPPSAGYAEPGSQ